MFIPDTLTRRYNDLDGQINQRNQQLQNALTQSQGVQDSLDTMLRWLDDIERGVHRMEKGTILVVKRDPLVENIQEQKVTIFIKKKKIVYLKKNESNKHKLT